MAGRGNPLVDKDDLRDDVFEPNLRDEGAGFFSTLFTAGSNIGTDALTELGYLAQAVASPIDTGEAILRVAAGYAQKALPDSFEQYLPEDWATNKMYANAINDYYAEKYGSLEQAADSFAEQPVSVALDVFAVKALLTAVTKQAVKRSNATTKMAKTAEGTVLEGELAARAAADLKVAAELEKTVKYEGKLKYDESLGAYVPEAELAARTTLDAAEVAPIVSAIDEAVPTLNNTPTPDGLFAPGRLAEMDAAEAARVAKLSPELKAMEETVLMERMNMYSAPGADLEAIAKLPHTSEVAAARLADMAGDTVRVTADDIAYYEMIKKAESMGDDFEGIGAYFSPEQLAALEVATGRSVLDNGTPNFKDADLPFESVPAATTGIDLAGTRAGDGSLMAATRNQTVAPALAESAVKMADDAKVVASKADDAKMAAATQAELFSTGTAAQYELMQASKIANDLAKVTPDVPAVVGTRMLATSPETKLAKYADVEKKTTPRTAASIPQTKLDVDIKKVVPAVQRIASASGQGERGQDGSLLPMTPDKGIDLSEPFVPIVPERIDVEQPENTRPGWKLPHQFEGSTREGNYWSADFEDEHWNTPAGISEAMGIWGRPIGNRKIVNPR